LTHKERMIKAARGEMPDMLPYIPRIDLWYSANSRAGTLPRQHQGRTAYEISRAEGWGLMTASIDFTYQFLPEALLHRAIGAYALKEHVFKFVFSSRIGVRVKEKGGENRPRHGQRRPPRHRQEPGGHDAPGHRLRGGGPGDQCPG